MVKAREEEGEVACKLKSKHVLVEGLDSLGACLKTLSTAAQPDRAQQDPVDERHLVLIDLVDIPLTVRSLARPASSRLLQRRVVDHGGTASGHSVLAACAARPQRPWCRSSSPSDSASILGSSEVVATGSERRMHVCRATRTFGAHPQALLCTLPPSTALRLALRVFRLSLLRLDHECRSDRPLRLCPSTGLPLRDPPPPRPGRKIRGALRSPIFQSTSRRSHPARVPASSLGGPMSPQRGRESVKKMLQANYLEVREALGERAVRAGWQRARSSRTAAQEKLATTVRSGRECRKVLNRSLAMKRVR